MRLLWLSSFRPIICNRALALPALSVRSGVLILSILPAVAPVHARAQTSDPPLAPGETSVSTSTGGLMLLGSAAEDRRRLGQLLGRSGSEGFLLRSASTLTAPAGGDGLRVQALFGGATWVWNSALPFSQNDGSMWAGRGHSAQVTAGMRLEAGPIRLIVAPEIAYQQNLDFQTIPYNRSRSGGRSPYSSPWYDRPESIDIPSRFGPRSFATANLGQSSLGVSFGPVIAGASNENLWWGPGIRNAIVMSDHAPGIPQLFLRTAEPVTTPFGTLEARWLLGRLRESDYFDDFDGNDVRSLSSFAMAWRPAIASGLSLGFARSVYAPTREGHLAPAAAFDVFRDVGRPNASGRTELLREPAADQLFSLFGRWVFPSHGFEAYGEWARYEQPASLRDLLVLPHHSQGYTLGLQWARAITESAVARVQGEISYLEPSATYWQRSAVGWYSSRPVAQGYTHHGQVIGAAIGPGSSSQWLAADLFDGDRRQIGLFGGRIRWDNHAFYTAPLHPFFAHDVSLFGGIRGTGQVGRMDLVVELAAEGRMNYLYQSPSPDWNESEAVDIRNHSLRIYFTSRGN